ncbi:MAG: cysteine-rich small domain-containing protein [Clostridia bacterium]|nr:cysteine-rich small domain-containing protein [Clostridia bacterium]
MSENYKFVQNSNCEFFPCHKVEDESKFNCLFCYCPLYMLGEDCGGNYTYGDNGIKDCSHCLVPHSPGGYTHVMSKMGLVIERTRK